jgi:hypothetical protein
VRLPNASIVNQGTITAKEAGLVGFVAPQVENDGVITAKLGKVTLASGDAFTLDLYGDGLFTVAVSDAVAKQLVSNSGIIQADGGSVTLTAAAARQAVDAVVSNSGIIEADAVEEQDGVVTLTSSGRTDMSGTVEAAGGSVETSGATLNVTGTVTASTWLLDPNNITIQAAGSDTNVSGDPNFVSTNDSAIVTTGSIEAALNAGTSVTVATGSGGVNSQAGDIEVASSISKTAGGNASLTLQAYRNITVDTGVSIASTSGKLGVTLDADHGGSGGSIYLASGSSITSNGGDIVMGGGANPLTTAAVGDNAAGDAIPSVGGPVYKNGITLMNATLDAGDGNITMHGTSWGNAAAGVDYGVYIEGNSLVQTSGNGTISMTGVGGAGVSGYSEGIAVYGSQIQAAAGAITLTGTGGANTGGYSDGLDLETWGGSTGLIQTTSGAITLTGNGGSNSNVLDLGIYTSGGDDGVRFMTIRTASGNITLTGTGGTGGDIETGVELDYDTIIEATGTGSISITGTGGNGTDGGSYGNANLGVLISRDAGYASSITVNTGNLTITGTGNGAGSYNAGIYLPGGAVINSTGSGSITLTGTGANGAPGIQMDNTWDANPNAIGSGSTTGSILLKSAGSIVDSGTADTITTGGGSVTLDADMNGLGSGAISLSGTTISTSGGDIVLGGGANPLTTSAYGTAANENGITMNGATVNAGGGNITMNGTGYAVSGPNGISLINSTVQTSIGSVTLTGTGYDYGVMEESTGSNSLIQTTSGMITITGMSGTGPFNYGIGTFGANDGVHFATIHTVDGAISLTGTGGIGGDGEWGIDIDGGTAIAATGSGSVSIIGMGGNGTSGGSFGQGNLGVFISRDGGDETSITVNTGNLTITGTGNGAGSYNAGIWLPGGAVLNSTGSGSITLTGTGANGAAGIVMDNSLDSHPNAIGSGSTTGSVTLIADKLSLADETVTTTGTLTLKPYTSGTSAGVGTGGGNLTIDDAMLGTFSYGSLVIGGSNAGAMDIDTGVTFAAPVTFQTGSGPDITLAAPLDSSASGTAFTLASGGNFVNAAGSSAFDLTGGGRWLIYSESPADNTQDGLAFGFKRYDCIYGGSCPSFPGTGDGMLYSVAPVITVTADDKSKTYGAALPTFTGSISGSGLIDGDTLGSAVSGSPSYGTAATSGSNAGAYAITASAGSLASTLGYQFNFVSGTLTINPAPLTVTADNKSKSYGAVNPSLTYGYSGLVNGDTASVFTGGLATAATASSNAGGYAITQGTLSAGGNYDISFTPGVLTVEAAPLTTLPSSVEAFISQRTPQGWAYAPFDASAMPGHGSYVPLYADATLLQSLGYAEDDPHRWWTGVVR